MRKITLLAALFFLTPALLNAQTGEEGKIQAKKFAQTFYDWYLKKGTEHSMDDVVLKKKEVLSPTLYQALKADRDAQEKVPGEIVGIDFDPFLGAQDIAQKYVLGEPILKGSTYWISVNGWWNGKKPKKPDVTAEVQCQAAACVFTNFHYDPQGIPENENLLSVLKVLAKDRQKH